MKLFFAWIVGVLALGLTILGGTMFLRSMPFGRPAKVANPAIAILNAAISVEEYVKSHQNTMPRADTWRSDCFSSVPESLAKRAESDLASSGFKFAFNAALSKVPLREISDSHSTIMLVEIISNEANPVATPNRVVPTSRPGGRVLVAFVSGRSMLLTTDELKRYSWTGKSALEHGSKELR